MVAGLFLLTLGQWQQDKSAADVLVAELRSQLATEITRRASAESNTEVVQGVATKRDNDIFKLKLALKRALDLDGRRNRGRDSNGLRTSVIPARKSASDLRM